MPAFIGPGGIDAVAILSDLLRRAQAGDVELTNFYHRVNMGLPDEIQLEFIDVSGLRKRRLSPASVIKGIASGLLSVDVLPSGKPIEELGVTIEPIVGYRDFILDGTLDEVALLSRNQTEWPKFKPLIASCVQEEDNVAMALKLHDAPNPACGCGIYAFDTPRHEDMDFSCDVWGEIYMWGDTYICETGYRAEYAYPKSIFMRSYGTKYTGRVADAIREQYGIPVYIVPTRDGLTEGEVLERMIMGGGDTDNDDSTT